MATPGRPLLALWLLLVGAVLGQISRNVAPGDSCAGDELNLVVSGVRNSSGQPIVQARLEQPAGREPWRLELKVRDLPSGAGAAARRVMLVAVHGPNSAPALPRAERLQQDPDSSINYIEVIETSVSTPSAFEYQSGQPPRFRDYEKVLNVGRYKLHARLANWSRAAVACSREGATLAVPNSQREADALWQLKQGGSTARSGTPRARTAFGMALAGMERNAYLVGARRDTVTRNFTSVFGEPLSDVGFSTWAAPAESGEDCIAMYSNVGFFAVPCETELSFICELPL